MRHITITALAVAFSITSGSQVQADPAPSTGREHLALARTALADLDYTRARAALNAALRVGDLDRSSLVDAYRLSGQVAAAFGDADGAFDSYRRMLSVDATAKLPPGLAPKITAPFDRARAEMKSPRGLTARVRTPDADTVEIVVADDALHMAAAVVVAFRQPGTERRVRASLDGARAEVEVPAEAARAFRVRVIDKAGNELLVREGRLPAPEPKPALVEPSPTPTVGPITPSPAAQATAAPRTTAMHARWYVWGGLALGAAATSVYYGRRALDDWDKLDRVISESSSHSFQEARDLEDGGRRNQLYSNLGLGAAVGFGGVATYLLLRGSPSGENQRVVPAVSRHGASVVVQGVFR